MKVAVLFDNLGPYHVARLHALAQECNLLAVEINSTSSEYAWSESETVPFQRVTLNKNVRSNKCVRASISKALDEFGPEVVFIPGWSNKPALSALIWADAAGVPAILMSDSQAIDFRRSWWKEKIKRSLLIGFSGAIVAGKSHAAYAQQLGVDPQAIRHGYDVVDNKYFEEGAEAARASKVQVMQAYGLPEKYFIVSARFIEKKNLPLLLEAYARYRNALAGSTAWDLVILGNGELRQQIVDRIRALALESNVHLPGFRQYGDLPSYYGLAQALILPSKSEQWGLVVNEAMASRLPVLISERCGSATDLVKPGLNGFTFAPDDIDGLSDQMIRLTEMPTEQLMAMGARSSQIIANWSPTVFRDNALELATLTRRRHRARLPYTTRLALRAILWRW
jgi:glycosyltransferase involved in cell wall biosynthesis